MTGIFEKKSGQEIGKQPNTMFVAIYAVKK